MTLIGLEYLQHQETKRSNMANEALKQRSIDHSYYDTNVRASTAEKDRLSREKVASLDRESRERVASLDRESRESIADSDRTARAEVASLDRASRESIALADRNSRESIAAVEQANKVIMNTYDNIVDGTTSVLSTLGSLGSTIIREYNANKRNATQQAVQFINDFGDSITQAIGSTGEVLQGFGEIIPF